MKKLLIIFIASLISFANCSSTPSQPDEIVTKKNQALEFLKYGNDYFKLSLYDKALEYYFLALAYYVSVDNESGVIQIKSSIGSVYAATDNFSEALKIYEDALAKAKKNNLTSLVAQLDIKISEVYLRLHELDKALSYILAAKNLPQSAIPLEDLAILYHNLAAIQKAQKKYLEATANLKEAQKINLYLKRYAELASNYYMLALIYYDQANYAKALENLNIALDYDKRVENTWGIAKDLLAFGKVYAKSGQFSEAYDALKKTYLMYLALKQLYPELAIEKDLLEVLKLIIEIGSALNLDNEITIYKKEVEYLKKRLKGDQ